MIPKKLSIVDVETTGTSPHHDRIIEIGIIRIEELNIVDEYSTLINPHTSVDPFIQNMTGITPWELEKAPSFYSVKNRIRELLADSVFVAHNVLFDYSFIKSEFERLEESFTSKYCCSVKLSKALFPRFKRHNLDAIINRFSILCTSRHRALSDAKVIWEFLKLTRDKFDEKKLASAFSKVMKRPTLPIGISENVVDSLSEQAGVYIFYNKGNVPLYVGKSKRIRDRVLSHFSDSKRNPIDLKISQELTHIETIDTAGELGALLTESALVKQLKPMYNRQLRYSSSLLCLRKVKTEDGYSTCSIETVDQIGIDELDQIIATFKSQKSLKGFLIQVAKEYKLCLKLLGLEKTKKHCFYYHLDLCNGACGKKESVLKYNLRFDEAFYKTKIKTWPFNGPIAVKESSHKEEVFIIDKWCILGSIRNEAQSLDDINKEYVFDTDTYKILQKHIYKNQDLQIQNLKPFNLNRY